MDALISYLDYRAFLKDLIKQRKSRGLTQGDLARVMRCQAAYLSQVLIGKAELTEEHLLRLAGSLHFSDTDTEFLLLLLRFAKAGDHDLKTFLHGQIQRLNNVTDSLESKIKSNISSPNLELTSYYVSSWLPSLIHIATSCAHFQNAKSIAKRFGIDDVTVKFHLERLERFGLIKFENSMWIYQDGSVHFSKNSDLDFQLQTARRLFALNNLSFKRESDLHYSSVFATDRATARQVRSEFLRAIEQLHNKIEPTVSEDLYSVCIDFFNV